MKKISLIKQLWIFSAFFSLLTLSISFISYYYANQIAITLEKVGNVNLPAVRDMTLLDMYHDGVKSTVLESTLAATKNEKEKFTEIQNNINEFSENFQNNISELKKLNLSDKTKTAIDAAIPEINNYVSISKEIIKLNFENDLSNAEAKMNAFHDSFEKLEANLESLGELIEHEGSSNTTSATDKLPVILLFSISGVLLGIVMSVLINFSLSKSLKYFLYQVSKASTQVNQVSEKLAETNSNLSNIATETASSVEETVASLDELSSMVNLNTDNAKAAADISVASRQSAEKGESEIERLNAAMFEIKSSSKKMEEIINVIDDIAFQTNLLALNAAVEAARAGEQGKGFAVVAEAVRNLAQRSASAAKEINTMIKDSVAKIEDGSEIAEGFKDTLKQVVDSVKKISDTNSEIASASTEQASGIQQISTAMDSLDQSSQEFAQATNRVAESSNVMKDQAQNLNELIHEVKIGILGANANLEMNSDKVHTNKQKATVKNNVLPFDSKNKIQKMNSNKKDLTKNNSLNPEEVFPLDDSGSDKSRKIQKIENF